MPYFITHFDQLCLTIYTPSQYYAPWLGRWCSTDPQSLGSTPNVYDFVRQNPIMLVDPNGLAEQPSLLESIRQQAVVGSLLGVRSVAAIFNFLNPIGPQEIMEDQVLVQQLLSKGNYERAFEVATGFSEYFEIHREGEANEASCGEQAAVMLGHATGFNQAVETYKGETRSGAELKGFDRFSKGVDATLRLATTTLSVASGVRAVKGGVTETPRVRLPKSLTGKEMADLAAQIYKDAPLLQRITQAQKMTGQERLKELYSILNEFANKTGVKVEIVEEGVVQAASGNRPNYSSFRSKPGFLQIEQQVITDSDLLLEEIKHELSWFEAWKVAGGIGQPTPSLGDIRVWLGDVVEWTVNNGGRRSGLD